ncbi:MAG: GH25 family lysozyme [Ferruginibacter sp.]
MAKRKKRSLIRTVIVTIIVLAALSMAAYYLSNYFLKPSFKHYTQYGIDIPRNYSIHGIDVSKHQGIISWKDVKEMQVQDVKIDFAFIKATEGISLVDEQFRRNWFNAEKAGVTKGAYHFFIASKSGKAQAENFIETVKLEKGDLYPVLDVEQTNGTSVDVLQQRVADWLLMVEKQYHVKPIIYTNADFYRTFLAGRFDDYPLWVAHYFVLNKPRIERNWYFWQHNETGHVNGIGTFVDFNVFNGDSILFKKLLVP